MFRYFGWSVRKNGSATALRTSLLQGNGGVLHPAGGSSPPAGFLFRVHLRVSGNWRASDSQNIQKTSPLQTPRVLLVDKDAISAETSRKLLEELGCRVTSCITSAEALTWLHAASEKFNCVISDLSMPGISGLESANTARLCAPNTIRPSCGDAQSLPADFLRTLGISGFLLKPFSIDHLSETLDLALSSDRRF